MVNRELCELAERCLRIADTGNDEDGPVPFEGLDDQAIALQFAPLARFVLEMKRAAGEWPLPSGNSEGI